VKKRTTIYPAFATRKTTTTMKTMIAILAAALLCSCATSVPVGNRNYTAVSPSNVSVIYQEPHRPYNVLALVGFDGGLAFSLHDRLEKARVEAAQYGANAVLITDAQQGSWTNSGTHLRGQAIRWQ
jgi:hypothetical protein